MWRFWSLLAKGPDLLVLLLSRGAFGCRPGGGKTQSGSAPDPGQCHDRLLQLGADGAGGVRGARPGPAVLRPIGWPRDRTGEGPYTGGEQVFAQSRARDAPSPGPGGSARSRRGQPVHSQVAEPRARAFTAGRGLFGQQRLGGMPQHGVDRRGAQAPAQPRDEVPAEYVHPRPAAVGDERGLASDVGPQADVAQFAGLGHALDQVQDDRVRPVLDPSDRVVDEVGAAGDQVEVEFRIGVAVGVGEQDPSGRHAVLVQEVQGGMCGGPDLGVDRHGHARLPGRRRSRGEPAFLVAVDPVVGSTEFDDSGLVGAGDGAGEVPVVDVHADLEVVQEYVEERRVVGVAGPVSGRIVRAAVVAGRGDDVKGACAGDLGELAGAASEADRRQVDDGADAARRDPQELGRRLVGVEELVTRVDRGAQEDVLVGIHLAEFGGGDRRQGPSRRQATLFSFGSLLGGGIARLGPASRAAA